MSIARVFHDEEFVKSRQTGPVVLEKKMLTHDRQPIAIGHDSADLKMSISRVFHDEEFVKSRQTEEKMCVD